MTGLPPIDTPVLYRQSVHDEFCVGRVCGRQMGGRKVKPQVEIETADGDRIMVLPENVEMT